MSDLISEGQFIVDGLSHHFKNYKSFHVQITNDDLAEFDLNNVEVLYRMKHEAVAYFNRIGQFYYFTKSNEVSNRISDPSSLIPRLLYFLPFRHKQSAHRATDKPQGEDMNLMGQLNRLFSFQSLIFNNRLVFQIMLEKAHGTTGRLSINFDLLDEHPIIISESQALLSALKLTE